MSVVDFGIGKRSESERRDMGAVYTPAELASWVVSLLKESAGAPIRTILDPACGDGALLRAAQEGLPDLSRVAGVDLSSDAIEEARAVLVGTSADLNVSNALVIDPRPSGQTDAVIMNPPWGAESTISTQDLRAAGYSLAFGQYDSWDLFVEWSLRALSPGTVVAAILPDAAFLPEHVAARRLLLQRARLQVVARLGEGWFPGVYRGVAVIVYTVGAPTTGLVRTVRVDHEARRRVLDGRSTLAEEAAAVDRQVSAQSWIDDPSATFSVTRSEFGGPWTSRIQERGGNWVDWFNVGRGVEIGAAGRLTRCVLCGWHQGPSRRDSKCRRCGGSSQNLIVEAIVGEPIGEDWVPLIVGRDVGRFQVEPSRWLRTGLYGVAYKSPLTYRPAKLLVRKTGLGINAAVDYSGAHTNQVVFHFVPKASTPDWVLHYVEGILCSKVMLAFHLSRTGETEWRSHPYVTPKVLATLPIPVPRDETALRQAEAISSAVMALRGGKTVHRAVHESRVDDLVAGMFHLDEGGCTWVEAALRQTQQLQAFAHLRGPGVLRKEVVA